MKLVPLQYLRAVAALSVLLYHSSYYMEAYRGDASVSTVFGRIFGSFGVFSFFALSGLLMATQARKLADDPSRFLTHRVIRIYPALFLAFAIRVGLAWALNLGCEFDPLALFLAPLGKSLYLLGIEWTLVYEVFFYLLVLVVIALRLVPFLNVIAVIWLVVLLAVNWTTMLSPQLPSVRQLPLSAICIPFALGLLIPEIIRRKLVRQSFLAGGLFVFLLAEIPSFTYFGIFLQSIGCVMVVAWCAVLIDQKDTHSLAFEKLGDWSFSIYLIHVPMLTTIYQLLPVSVSPMAAWVIAVASAIVAGCILGGVDVRIYQGMKGYFDAAGGSVRWALCGAFAILFAGSIVLSQSSILSETRLPAELAELKDARSEIDIDRVMELAGYRKDTALLGGVTVMVKEAGETVAGGWLNDTKSLLNRSNVIVVGGSTPGVLVPRDYRLDVLKVYGSSGFLAPVGFHQAIASQVCPSGSKVSNVAISQSRRVYWMLSDIACP
jgi:exopolysaccharide production protein ExoZ